MVKMERKVTEIDLKSFFFLNHFLPLVDKFSHDKNTFQTVLSRVKKDVVQTK